MDDVQLLKENTSNECEDSRVKRNAAKQIQSPLEEGQVNSAFGLPRVCSGWLKLIMVFNRSIRILSSLLVFAFLFSAFVSAENKKSPAVLCSGLPCQAVLLPSQESYTVSFQHACPPPNQSPTVGGGLAGGVFVQCTQKLTHFLFMILGKGIPWRRWLLINFHLSNLIAA